MFLQSWHAFAPCLAKKALFCLAKGRQRLQRFCPEFGDAGLTFVEFPAELVIGAALHHFCDMFCFLIHWHGADDGTLRGRRHHLDLNGTRLGNLAVQLLQFCGVLQPGRKERPRQEATLRNSPLCIVV